MTTTAPLVSIGMPTYNRVGSLERALRSALSQTHTELEVVICDNASMDGTEQLCRSVAAQDSRVRYVRHAHNIGPTANFNTLFDACAGSYVMMLADDDWLDAEYVSACLQRLRADSALALVAGLARYVREADVIHDGVAHEHRQPDGGTRLLDYLRQVEDNGIFYGLMPREVLQRARPLPNVLGNDWLHLARVVVQGQVITLDDVNIHRELGGTSVDVSSILATFESARWQARAPQLVIAWQLLRDIGWAHPVYRRLGRAGRLRLGLLGAFGSIRWRHLAWALFTPAVAAISRRSRGRRVASLYFAFTRALGAGQAR